MHNQCAERRRFFAPRGLAGRQQGQVVAALAIRDAVGDAISRRQAAVKPGPWPGRRAAGEALSRGLGRPASEDRALGGLRSRAYVYLASRGFRLPLPPAV